MTDSGLQYKDLRDCSGDIASEGSHVTIDWDGYTLGYYGRPFEARNKVLCLTPLAASVSIQTVPSSQCTPAYKCNKTCTNVSTGYPHCTGVCITFVLLHVSLLQTPVPD